MLEEFLRNMQGYLKNYIRVYNIYLSVVLLPVFSRMLRNSNLSIFIYNDLVSLFIYNEYLNLFYLDYFHKIECGQSYVDFNFDNCIIKRK